MVNIPDIIKENEARRGYLNRYYNPLTGEGSNRERRLVPVDEIGDLYLPTQFLDTDFGYLLENTRSLKKLLQVTPEFGNLDNVAKAFLKYRCKYDFEFWCAYAINIEDGKTLRDVPFILNNAQRLMLDTLLDDFFAGIPVLVILVKARQWGGSTLSDFFMMWIQELHEKNWHMAICAQDDGAAGNVREKMMNAAALYPPELGKITYRPYAKSPKNVEGMERGGIVGIGSINNPRQFRSYNYTMLHMTEVCEWDETAKRGGAKIVTSLRSVLKGQPHSVEIVESTAKGVGNFFHNEWLDAKSGKSDYRPIFVSHNQIEIYQKRIKCSYEEFIKTMDEYDWFLWNNGSTLENIHWYNYFKKQKNYNDWQMKQEYPTTADEAFQSSGISYFPAPMVKEMEKLVCPPVFIGNVVSNARKGEEALKNIQLVENKENGVIKIWHMPETYVDIEGDTYFVKDRYCGFADVSGGTSETADFNSLTIIDRYWMIPEINGGVPGIPEVALDWHARYDADLFAWECAMIGKLYGDMLLAIEENKLNKTKSAGGDFLTVLDEIKDFYPNLFIRNAPKSINKDFKPEYGWWETNQSKEWTCQHLLSLLRDKGYVEPEQEALNEMYTFEKKKDGTLGAMEGNNDDKVTTRKGALWLALKYMPLPQLIKVRSAEEDRLASRGNILNESSF